MKTTLFSVLLLLFAMKSFGQRSFKVPKTWDESFTISVAHTGSMSGATSHTTLRYDTGTYEASSMQGPAEKKSILLTQQDREKILAMLRTLRIESVKDVMDFAPQNDGWSTVLCIGGNCIDGGSASRMSEKDKGIFLAACGFLEEFVTHKK